MQLKLKEREFLRAVQSPDVTRRSPTKVRAKFKDDFKTLIEQAEKELDSDSDDEVNMKTYISLVIKVYIGCNCQSS